MTPFFSRLRPDDVAGNDKAVETLIGLFRDIWVQEDRLRRPMIIVPLLVSEERPLGSAFTLAGLRLRCKFQTTRSGTRTKFVRNPRYGCKYIQIVPDGPADHNLDLMEFTVDALQDLDLAHDDPFRGCGEHETDRHTWMEPPVALATYGGSVLLRITSSPAERVWRTPNTWGRERAAEERMVALQRVGLSHRGAPQEAGLPSRGALQEAGLPGRIAPQEAGLPGRIAPQEAGLPGRIAPQEAGPLHSADPDDDDDDNDFEAMERELFDTSNIPSFIRQPERKRQ
jgi:hypothetical protein